MTSTVEHRKHWAIDRFSNVNKVRTEAVSKFLRDDYTFVSHCSVSCLMLMTTARLLGDHDTEELAERGYRDCTRLVIRIDRVMPSLVFEELRQDGFAAQDVARLGPAYRVDAGRASRSAHHRSSGGVPVRRA